MSILVELLLGVLVVVVITAATGWFVAQEFAFTAVDRARLRVRAKEGDAAARRALGVTGRTSFMLSGAQLGITVTGLLVGYVAEPLIGEGLAEVLGGRIVPDAVALGVGTALALLFATVVQMVFGELFPKNLAIARPEALARSLATSTSLYLTLFGWLIGLFDRAAELLLRLLRIEPVHDVEQTATPSDLEAIIDESREAGALPDELSLLLDRVLEFGTRTAREAMVPRTRTLTVQADLPASALPALMVSGHSRLPVLGRDPDDVVGIVCLRDLLSRPATDLPRLRVADLARPAVLVPESQRLQGVLDTMRGAGEELACVLDEHGGLAGVITLEDVAEELVGEITDEHDPAEVVLVPAADQPDAYRVAGDLGVDEAERLLDLELPAGDWTTVGGLVVALLQRLPEPGDSVDVPVVAPGGATTVLAVVEAVERRVPSTLTLRRTVQVSS
jgi:CBS domain containing-hemolysin-like protein